jgi:hypothetical protein
MIIPSTTVTVYRTDEASPPVNEYGDAVDSDIAVATKLPAWIEETTRTTRDPGSGQLLVINGFKVLLRPKVFEFRETDRLVDEHTNLVYQVETVGITSGFASTNIRLFCTLVR